MEIRKLAAILAISVGIALFFSAIIYLFPLTTHSTNQQWELVGEHGELGLSFWIINGSVWVAYWTVTGIWDKEKQTVRTTLYFEPSLKVIGALSLVYIALTIIDPFGIFSGAFEGAAPTIGYELSTSGAVLQCLSWSLGIGALIFGLTAGRYGVPVQLVGDSNQEDV
jgi:hypothetical protein